MLTLAHELDVARTALIVARTDVNGGFGVASAVRDAISRLDEVLGTAPDGAR